MEKPLFFANCITSLPITTSVWLIASLRSLLTIQWLFCRWADDFSPLFLFIYNQPLVTFTFFCLVKPLLLHYFHLQDNNKILDNYEDATSKNDITRHCEKLPAAKFKSFLETLLKCSRIAKDYPTETDLFTVRCLLPWQKKIEHTSRLKGWRWWRLICRFVANQRMWKYEHCSWWCHWWGLRKSLTIKNWWLFLIWILENACVLQYIINNCREQIDMQKIKSDGGEQFSVGAAEFDWTEILK